MPRRVRNLLAAIVLTACVVGSSASALAAERGTVGGPPTRSSALTGVLHHRNSVTAPIVIGRGRGAGQRIELVAFHAKGGLCIVISRPRLGRRGDAHGTCGAAPRPFADFPLDFHAGSSEWTRARGWLYFEEEWALSPAVARLGVAGRVFGRSGMVPAKVIYANPTPSMLQRLRETTPFSLALSVWPDCVLEETVQATAFDAAGTPLGSTNTGSPNECF